MKITVVGSGYVGLVSGACFASLGNHVVCVDNNSKKIAMLKKGGLPIYEPGLEELVHEGRRNGTLKFTTDLASAVRCSEVIFIAVGTPPKESGDADLSFVENVARTVAGQINGYKLIVEKSTVPVQTGQRLRETISNYARKNAKFDVASNPEFLREGSAVNDFMHPDRVVLGVESARAKKILTELYGPLKCPILVTDINSAEIIKHASNSFLAAKISFINALSRVCELANADVEQVAVGMGMDRRIGRQFLDAGIGFGGFCFPKDLQAFIRISEKLGYDFKLLREVYEINESQRGFFIDKIEKALWNVKAKRIGVLGLAFKPNTDDMRFAPSLSILEELVKKGAEIQVFDPHAMANARALLGKKLLKHIRFCANSYDACKGADCVALITEWSEFAELDLSKVKKLMRHPLIVDGRNLYQPQRMKRLGFRYHSIGRGKI